MPVSQEFHSRQLFDSALKLMDANDPELANLFLMEGLAIDPFGPGRPGFAAPSAPGIRRSSRRDSGGAASQAWKMRANSISRAAGLMPAGASRGDV